MKLKKILYCDFCEKNEYEVDKIIIAGRGNACICDKCAEEIIIIVREKAND